MVDHIILTVSDVERSLKFYTAALKPLKIEMFMPYKGADGAADVLDPDGYTLEVVHKS